MSGIGGLSETKIVARCRRRLVGAYLYARLRKAMDECGKLVGFNFVFGVVIDQKQRKLGGVPALKSQREKRLFLIVW